MITKDIENSKMCKDVCLVVNVGNNDAHDGGKVSSRDIHQKFKGLIRAMKNKSNKCIVNSILPRLRSNPYCMNRVDEINKSLKALCDKENIMFNDISNAFMGKPSLFRHDGIHLSNKGIDVMSQLMNIAVNNIHEIPSVVAINSPGENSPTAIINLICFPPKGVDETIP